MLPLAAGILLQVVLHAPAEEQVNVYKLRESVSTSQFGKVVMTGTETRKIGHLARRLRDRAEVVASSRDFISGDDYPKFFLTASSTTF